MKLFEAIFDANQRQARGDKPALLRPEDFPGQLPVAVVTCIDPRLNLLVPQALNLPEDKFIWLRNAGNIITGPLSSTLRSISLACLVKGGREIAVIGHTDCLVGRTSVMQITDRLRDMGIDRARLPENLVEYFGMFASERQNVIKGADHIRNSPIIGAKIPVHGFLMDVQTGRLEWIVNGYESLAAVSSRFTSAIRKAEAIAGGLSDLPEFQVGGMKFPSDKIGDMASKTSNILRNVEDKLEKIESAFHRVDEKLEVSKPGGPAASAASAADAGQPKNLLRKIQANRRYRIIGNDQKVYGPVPAATIQQWIEDSRVDAQTPVQMEGSTAWQPLGLLPEAGKGPANPPPLPGGNRTFAKRNK